jgi:hypothetical protein
VIYLLDTQLEEGSHSHYICDVIKQHTDIPIEIVEISAITNQKVLFSVLHNLFFKVTPADIVLCPWVVSADDQLDELFSELSSLTNVVVSAGNFKEPIHKYSPARNPDVITVGTLNKQGLVAALSNYSYNTNKEIKWVPGTNYNVGWRNGSGTSVSAALYAAFLAEAIKQKDLTLVDTFINRQKELVFDELHRNDK